MRYFESLAAVEDYLAKMREMHRQSSERYGKLAQAERRASYEPSKTECQRLSREHFAKTQAYDDALQALLEIRPDMAAALRESVTGIKETPPMQSYEDRIRAGGRGSANRAGDFR